ncbi:probable nuclear control of ATPase protein 2 at C-terminar half [Coccomyxa sp. Obi]|nr:probable nuclear control of ATPase protein 2 at C-terminar half [Coccomyxa sp. Obi]
MVSRLLKKVLLFPVRVLSRTYRAITAATTVPDVLPVGGLSGERASGLLFALRQIIQTDEEEAIAVQWLTSLQLAQIASDRLLHDVETADSSFQFWSARLKSGAHRSFLLLGQGPTSFVFDCIDAVRGRRRLHSGALKQPNATDQIERRVILLRALRGRLCEALAKVHNGAAQLNLAAHSQAARSLSATAHPCVGGPAGDERERLLAAAHQAALHCALSISEAVDEARRAAEELTACPPDEGHAETAAAVARAAVRAARALGERAARKMQRLMGFVLSDAADSGPAHVEEEAREEPSQPAEDSEDNVGKAIERAAVELVFESSVAPATSANAALSAAASASWRRHGIIRIPDWLAAPSKYKQHWIRYSLIGLACFWSGRFLYMHSPLAGSDDLERWGRSAAEAVAGAYRDRVLAPLLQLKDELFATFRQRRSIVSVGDYETDKASLERMLRDFEADFGKSSTRKMDPEVSAALDRVGPGDRAAAEGDKPGEMKGIEEGDELLPGMAFMMGCYEDELKKPIRNLVNGSLLRAILIQVQKLKLDTESAMLELDQILRANELTVAVVAAVPSLLIAGGTTYLLFRWLTPAPPDRRSQALPARMAMVEVERTIQRLTEEGTPEQQGHVIWRVARVYWETRALYRQHTGLGVIGLTVQSEWPNLRVDLLELVAPNSPKAKMATCHRMQRAYSLFQP